MDSRHIAEYHLWAGQKTREVVRLLSNEEFEKKIDNIIGSAKDKAIHMVNATLFCFHQMKINFEYLANNPQTTIKQILSLSRKEFMKCWELSDKRFAELFMENRSGTVTVLRKDGEEFCVQINDFLFQYLFHTIYHRGQLNYCLKALEKPRVDSDYLFYFEELDKRLELME
jgi:uncharacterized damage-inducible protein DinB